MPDNSSPFDFDDDNMDWLNADLPPADDADNVSATPGQSSAPPPAPPSTGGSEVAPWQQKPGGAPPAPRQTTAPAPWQQKPGSAPPPPAAPRTRPPWGESAPPPPVSAAAPAGLADDDLAWLTEDDAPTASADPAGMADDDLAWLAEDDAPTTGAGAGDEFGAIDWDSADRAPDSAQSSSELPSGMTGHLPWRQAASDAGADTSMADLAGLSGESFADAGLFDDTPAAADTGSGFALDDDLFAVDEPASDDALDLGDDFFAVDDAAASPGADILAPEPPDSTAPPSLRDRLLAASPATDSTGEAADLGDLFGEDPDPTSDAADLGDLFGEEPAAASDAADLGDLFGEEPDPTSDAADLGDLFGEEPDPAADSADLGDLFGEESATAEPAANVDELGAILADDFGALDTADATADTADGEDSWLDDAFEEFTGEPAPSQPEPDLPTFTATDEPAGSADLDDEAEDLGMQFDFDDFDTDEEEVEVLPDWLQGDVEFDEPEPEPVAPRGIQRIASVEPPEEDEPASDLEAWIGEANWDDSDGDSTLDDLTYEEWEHLHDEDEQAARRESELLESVPDMFQSTDGQPATPPPDAPPVDAATGTGPDTGTQFVPGWFVGLEDTSSDDAPEWFQQADLSGDFLAAPVDPTPDDTAAETPDESAGGDMPDWFKAPETPVDDTPDWFKAPASDSTPTGESTDAPTGAGEEPIIDPPTGDESDLNWMASATATPEESESLPLPKTGALFGLETPIPQPEIDPPPPGAGDNWLDEVRLAAAQDELDEQILPQTGQLFASDLPDQPEQPAQPPQPAEVSDPLADLPDDPLTDLPDDILIEPPSVEPTQAGLPGELFGDLSDDEPADSDDRLAALPLPGTGTLFGGLVDGSGLDDMSTDDADDFPEAAFGDADDLLSELADTSSELDDTSSELDDTSSELASEPAFDGGDVWEEEPEVSPGELPDWIDQVAAEDQRIDPADVPFPDIDLDQTMPGEMAVTDLNASIVNETAPRGHETADLEGEPPPPEPWMAAFEPQGEDADFFMPKSPGTSPLIEDFVERFDPVDPEPAASEDPAAPAPDLPAAAEEPAAPAPDLPALFEDLVPAEPAAPALDEEAPAWLRELGDEGALLNVPDDVNLFAAAEADSALTGAGDNFNLGLDDDMDWLSAISEDTVAELDSDEPPPIDFDRALTVPEDSLPQVVDTAADAAANDTDWDADWADEIPVPEPVEDSVAAELGAVPLDSSALDALLGLDDAVIEDTSGVDPDKMPALPPDSELAMRAEQESALALPDESMDDLEAMFANAPTGGTGMLPTLFDERIMGDTPDLAAVLADAGTPGDPGELTDLDEIQPAALFDDAASLDEAMSLDEATSLDEEMSLDDAESLDIFPDDPFDTAEKPAAAEVKAEEEVAEVDEKPRRGLFGRRRKKTDAAATPTEAPPVEPQFVDVEAADEADMRPEWIDEMRPSDLPVAVRTGGAELSIKQKQITELPDRLRVFHERAQQELAAPAALPAAESGPLAGIAGALPASDLMQPTAADRAVEGLVISIEQQKRIAQLNALLEQAAAEEQEFEEERAELEEVAEAFSYSEFDDDDEAGAQPEPQAAPARARRRRRFKTDRVIIALLMLVALVVPFFSDVFHFASDPPPLGDDQEIVALAIDFVAEPGAYVLFAFEYGPTAAGELDPLAEAVIRDVLAHGAIPLTISTDPAGALHAAAVIDPLTDDPALLSARADVLDNGATALVEGADYVLLRYLTGEAVGVRSLRTVRTDAAGNVQQHPAFETNLRGEDTDLPIGDLGQDIALIVVIGEDSTAIRTWAEQLPDLPKIALVTAALEPLTIPYVIDDESDTQGYGGYLAGMRDTYSYNAARNTANRTPYTVPEDAPDVPDPVTSQWHSTALGAAMAALLIALGMIVNLLRGLRGRRR